MIISYPLALRTWLGERSFLKLGVRRRGRFLRLGVRGRGRFLGLGIRGRGRFLRLGVRGRRSFLGVLLVHEKKNDNYFPL